MKNSITFVFLLSLAALCSSTPLGDQLIISQNVPNFAGSTTACRKPNSTFCGIDYLVPDAIATLVDVIEGEVSYLAADINTDEGCFATKKEILCAQRFPRCEEGSVIFTSTPNCVNNLEDSCHPSSYNSDSATFCGLTDATVPLGTCSALSTFAPLQQCNVLGQDTLVTEWMYKLISFRDLQLAERIGEDTTIFMIARGCLANYATYFCQLLGECSEDGSQVKVINDYQFCEDTINCFDQTLYENFRGAFPCDHWSSLNYPPTVPPTTATTSKNGPRPSQEPSIPPLPGNGAVPQCTLTLVVLIVGLLSALLL